MDCTTNILQQIKCDIKHNVVMLDIMSAECYCAWCQKDTITILIITLLIMTILAILNTDDIISNDITYS